MTEPKTALREVREALKRSNRYIRCIGGGDTAESVLTYKCNERALSRLDAVLAQAETYYRDPGSIRGHLYRTRDEDKDFYARMGFELVLVIRPEPMRSDDDG